MAIPLCLTLFEAERSKNLATYAFRLRHEYVEVFYG